MSAGQAFAVAFAILVGAAFIVALGASLSMIGAAIEQIVKDILGVHDVPGAPGGVLIDEGACAHDEADSALTDAVATGKTGELSGAHDPVWMGIDLAADDAVLVVRRVQVSDGLVVEDISTPFVPRRRGGSPLRAWDPHQ